MASLQERDRLVKDKEFRTKLTFTALGKCKDKQVALDLVVDTLSELLEKNEDDIKGVDNLEAYTFGILYNQIRWYFSNSKKKGLDVVPLPEEDIGSTTFTDPLIKIMIHQIEKELKKYLSEIEATVFDMHFKEGYKNAEIAQILKKKQGYIGKTIHKIRHLANGFKNE